MSASEADLKAALAPHAQAFASEHAQRHFMISNGDLASVSPPLLAEAVKVRLAAPDNAHFLKQAQPRFQPGSVEASWLARNGAPSGGLRGNPDPLGRPSDGSSGLTSLHQPRSSMNSEPTRSLDDLDRAFRERQDALYSTGFGLRGQHVKPAKQQYIYSYYSISYLIMSFTLAIQSGVTQGGVPVAQCGWPVTVSVTPSGSTSDVLQLTSTGPGVWAQPTLIFSASSTAQLVGFTPLGGPQTTLSAVAQSGTTVTGALLLVNGSAPAPGQAINLGVAPGGLPALGMSGVLGGATTFATGLSGVGTVQATATPIPTANNVFAEFATVTSGTGAILPNVSYPAMIKVVNDGANALLIYPNSGGTINGGSANASVSLAAGAQEVFWLSSAGNWKTTT
jgi:hypothetical protein